MCVIEFLIKSKQIKKSWVSSHSVIFVKELADTAAKESTKYLLHPYVLIPVLDFKLTARHEEMDHYLLPDSIENKLRSIKTDAILGKTAVQDNRKKEVFLSSCPAPICLSANVA